MDSTYQNEPARAPPISYDFDSSGPPHTAFFGQDMTALRPENSQGSKKLKYHSPSHASYVVSGDDEPPRPLMLEDFQLLQGSNNQGGNSMMIYGGQSQSIGQIGGNSSMQRRRKKRMGMSTGKQRSPLQKNFDDHNVGMTGDETDYAELRGRQGGGHQYGGVMSNDEEEQTVYSRHYHQQNSYQRSEGEGTAGNHQEAAMQLINSYEKKKSSQNQSIINGSYDQQQPPQIMQYNQYEYNLPTSGGFGFSDSSHFGGVPNTPMFSNYQPYQGGKISDQGTKFIHHNFQSMNKVGGYQTTTYRVQHLPQVNESPGSQAKQGAKGILSNHGSRHVSPMSKYNNPKQQLAVAKQVSTTTNSSALQYKKNNLMMYEQSQIPDYVQQAKKHFNVPSGNTRGHRRGGQSSDNSFLHKLAHAGVPVVNKSMLNESLQNNTLDSYVVAANKQQSAADLISPKNSKGVAVRNNSMQRIDQQFFVNRAKIINTTRKVAPVPHKFTRDNQTNMLVNNLLQLQRNSQVATNGKLSQLSRKLNKQSLDNKSSQRSLHSEINKSVSLQRRNGPEFKSSPRARPSVNIEHLKPRRPLNISIKKSSQAVGSVAEWDISRSSRKILVEQQLLSQKKKISLHEPSSKMDQSRHLKDLLARNNLPRQPIILEKKKIKKVAQQGLVNGRQELRPQLDRLNKLNMAYKHVPSHGGSRMDASLDPEQLRIVSGKQRRDNNMINRQEVIRSVESMRQVRTANGKSRPKKGNASKANDSPPKGQKSRMSDSKASRNSRAEGVDNSFDRSREAIINGTRENSVSSHCKCSLTRRDYNTLQEDSVDTRNCPIHTGGSDYSGLDGGPSVRSPYARPLRNNKAAGNLTNRNRSLKQDSVSTDNRSMKSMNPSVKRFKLKLQEAEKKFINNNDTTSKSPRRKGYEQPIGCVSCPKCLKKMLKVDGIDKVMKMSVKHKKGKRQPWDDSTAFHNNQFKDAIKELTKKRSASQVSLNNKKSKFSLKDLPKYSKQLRGKSALGKSAQTLNDRLRELEKQNKKMKDQNKWEFLRNQCMLQQSDWYKSNLFQLYQKHGRQMLCDPLNIISPSGAGSNQQIMIDSVYTETELKYYIDFLEKVTMKKYRDDITSTKGELGALLEGHNIKAYSTLKWLMKMINFDYYYERILFRYQESEQEKIASKITDSQAIYNVIKIMVRSLQMYETIDQILLIFQLIGKIDKLTEKRKTASPKKKNEADSGNSSTLEVERLLSLRLLSVIKQLVTNNKFLQKRFTFKGVEMIEGLVKRVQEINSLLGKNGEVDGVYFALDDGGFSQE